MIALPGPRRPQSQPEARFSVWVVKATLLDLRRMGFLFFLFFFVHFRFTFPGSLREDIKARRVNSRHLS